MLQFEKLRLSGFKSFVDKTELEIAPGLNGIVGPNGCGKSNLVEALRWVMGESSAKRMRGDGMEDVIFNGTDQRSARNIAEVSLLLSNNERSAPAAYNGLDDIEVTRRIERDRGSNYKINGKNTRARDVQMLFADTVTGANSPALVSQGQISKIISAKPIERRIILEESAGISGLYARRHEAEIRLKAADTNLTRINDILGGLETRLNALRRQARMAAKYKNLNAQIRQFDLAICYLEYRDLKTRITDYKAKFEQAEQAVNDKMLAVTQLSKTQDTLHTDLPALRKAEIEIATQLQTVTIELQRIEETEARKTKTIADLKQAITQAESDLSHESTIALESEETLAKRDQEHETIVAAQSDSDNRLKSLKEALDQARTEAKDKDAQYTAAMESAADSRARTTALENTINKNSARLETLMARQTELKNNLKTLDQESGSSDPKAHDTTLANLQKDIAKTQTDLDKTQRNHDDMTHALKDLRSHADDCKTRCAKIDTEIDVLNAFLSQQHQGDNTPVRDQIKPQGGFEIAVSRALGDSLLASMDDDALSRWVTRSAHDLPALPQSIPSLQDFVEAPAVLDAALSQIGVVDDAKQAQDLLSDLKTGQSLVTREGTYVRWDGYMIKAEASDRNADVLKHRNKLDSLTREKAKADQEREKAEAAVEDAHNKMNTITQSLKTLRESLQDLKSRESAAHIARVQQEEAIARHKNARDYTEKSLAELKGDISALQETISTDEAQLRAYQNTDNDKDSQTLDTLKAAREDAQTHYQDMARQVDQLEQSVRTHAARLQAIGDERLSVKNRMIRAQERQKTLEIRLADLKENFSLATADPIDNKAKKQALMDKIAGLEKDRSERAEKLAARETEIAHTMKAMRDAEQSLSDSREKRGAAQASLQTLADQAETLSVQSRETFDLAPTDLEQHITLRMSDDETPQMLKSRRSMMVSEREKIGAVNLRAEDELKELEADSGTLIAERDDLVQAVEELREGIDKINKEARDRLMQAFETVNAHFQTLFTRLFNGGQAHLALTKTDDNAKDPLVSGLEIFAQPPGKSLQNLSLLSGGEQTLASIALIFAMFLTNPSPICVLDEIDAPLDDANVERVCDMLDHIISKGKTRFLIVTHHRLTMARMDRLYGVTMSEKGVSQLVSVDLQQSFGFLDAA